MSETHVHIRGFDKMPPKTQAALGKMVKAAVKDIEAGRFDVEEPSARERCDALRAKWDAANPEPEPCENPSSEPAFFAWLDRWEESPEAEECQQIMREAREGGKL